MASSAQGAREPTVAGQRVGDRHLFCQMDLKTCLEDRRGEHVAFRSVLQLVTLYEAFDLRMCLLCVSANSQLILLCGLLESVLGLAAMKSKATLPQCTQAVAFRCSI